VANLFFNNFDSSGEQFLIDDLVRESIDIYGIDVDYLPAFFETVDELYLEDDLKKFNEHATVSMYIRDIEGFQGEGDFLGRFGVEIRDTMTLAVAKTTFERDVGQQFNLDRPREGDLIYFPLNQKVFQIMFTEHEPIFYQLGAIQFYEVRLELFTYNNERFNTGILEIDSLEDNLSYDITLDSGIQAESGLVLNTEVLGQVIELDDVAADREARFDDIADADNIFLEGEADNIIDFSDADPFSEGGRF
jgi:hypothetical protein